MSDVTKMLSPDSLADIKSWDDALALMSDAKIAVVSAKEFGDGFEVVDKKTLINSPFIILSIHFADGDYTNPDGTPQKFGIIRAMTKDGRKVVITDGSQKSGLKVQMKKLAASPNGGVGVVAEDGLIVSEYDYFDDKGVKAPARTYYLSGM